jgi:hypothetical protein
MPTGVGPIVSIAKISTGRNLLETENVKHLNGIVAFLSASSRELEGYLTIADYILAHRR